MTVDRELIRQALLAWQVEITTPGDATTDSWHALQDVVFGDGPELLLALLAELEQAKRDLEGVHWALAEADVPRAAGNDEPLYSEQHRVRLLRERAEAAERRLAKVPALVEALREIAEMDPPVIAVVNGSLAMRVRDALADWDA